MWCDVFFFAGSGDGVEDCPGSLPSVRGLPGAAGRQVVNSKQLHWQEPDRLECGGGSNLHLAPQPGPPAQVHTQIIVENLISKAW